MYESMYMLLVVSQVFQEQVDKQTRAEFGMKLKTKFQQYHVSQSVKTDI